MVTRLNFDETLWDNGPNHKGDPLRAVRAAYPRLDIEWLPPYAPELNPVERVWLYLRERFLSMRVAWRVAQLR